MANIKFHLFYRAPLDQMRARAAGDTSKSTLVTNEQLPK